MSTPERQSLTSQIRQQVALNSVNGDKKSLRGGRWKTYESFVGEYDETFSPALGTSISSFISRRKSPVVIDLMAPAFTLSQLFAFTKFSDRDKFGLAVSLSDGRTAIRKMMDANIGVHQIAGDIMKSSTWREIYSKLKGRKADLIMERAVGGLDILPTHPKLYAILINNAWQVLSDREGVMLLQTPSENTLLTADIEIQSVVNDLRAKGINIECHKSGSPNSNRLVLKLVKTPGSPEKIPFEK